MKISAAKLLLGATMAGSALLLGGCGTGGGYVGVVDTGPDYYGPGYGGAVFYGHPGYRADSYVARPPERHFEGHAAAPAAHAAPAPRGGGGAPQRR